MNRITTIRLAGLLMLAGIAAGIFSVAPSIDTPYYLTTAFENAGQVMLAAFFQLVLSFAYMGVTLLLYPGIRKRGRSLATGFLSFRIIAVCFSLLGTLLLLALLALSREYMREPSPALPALEALGLTLKMMRDYLNHLFMILALCAGNAAFYTLLLKSGLVPRWLSLWGMAGALLSVTASLLFLSEQMSIISWPYLALNAPMAIQELVLGLWLLVKGFDLKRMLPAETGMH